MSSEVQNLPFTLQSHKLAIVVASVLYAWQSKHFEFGQVSIDPFDQTFIRVLTLSSTFAVASPAGIATSVVQEKRYRRKKESGSKQQALNMLA